MNVLITVTWRAGASQAENRAAAQVVQERLMNPFPGVTIIHTLADLGKAQTLRYRRCHRARRERCSDNLGTDDTTGNRER